MPAKAKAPPGWRPVSEAAELFGVSLQAFHKTYRPLIAKEDVQESGKNTLLRIRGLIDAWVSHRVKAEAIAAGVDPDMAGGDSPNLERYRLWKANQEELKFKAMEKNLIPRDELIAGLGQFFESLRRAVDKLIRTHGNAAGDMIARACDEAVAGWEEMLKRDNDQPADGQPSPGAGGEGPAETDPDHAPVRRGRDRSANGTVPRRKVPRRNKSSRRRAAG